MAEKKKSRVWIGLKRRTVKNRPWVWQDGTNLDFRKSWPKNQAFDEDDDSVFMNADGSWGAMKYDREKLPFVCKLPKVCPQSES